MSQERRKQASKTIINRLFRILQILCNMLNLYENAHGFMQYKKWQMISAWSIALLPGRMVEQKRQIHVFPSKFQH